MLKKLKLILLCVPLAAGGCIEQRGPVLGDTPRAPTLEAVLPVPSPQQLAWQSRELSALLHFGINTFSDKEQGNGDDSPAIFNPSALDASQWMTALRSAGFRQAMLTAKHHDGFCLWPSKCTTEPVAASPWQAGQGDVVRQFVDAAHQANIRVGLALSPTDRHEPTFGTPAYEAVFRCQLTELLTSYGAIDEVWLWDDPGTPVFNWQSYHDLVHQLQPNALLDVGSIPGVAGGDVRSVAQALAVFATPDQTSVKAIPGDVSQTSMWYPAEALYSLRPGWFWHAAEDARVKTMNQLVTFYYDSVGRNSILLLNIPPNTQGLLADTDVAAIGAYGTAIRTIYDSNVAAARPASADSVFKDAADYAASMAVDGKLETFWAAGDGTTSARIEFDLGAERAFNVVSIQEPIALGERTTQHHVEAKVGGVWTTIATGTGIGQRKLHRVGAVTAASVALVITQARGVPAIAEFGVYLSPYP